MKRAWIIAGIVCLASIAAKAESAPPASSVLFSARWERPEARALAKDFSATHLVWLYPKTREYLAGIAAEGLYVGTTLNANQAVPDQGLARDLEGKPLIAPWMQSWGARWISIASPASSTALYDAASRHIAWGAMAIQFDDPALATASFNWGGDFSVAAVQGFGRWLAGPGAVLYSGLPAETRSGQFDYRNWLAAQGIDTTAAYLARRNKLALNPAWERYHLEEVRDFFGKLRSQLHSAKPAVALTLNLTNPRPDARTFNLIDLADGIVSETSASDPANSALGAATVQGVGASYQPSLQPHDTDATRRQIATFYALGALPLVPWDVYMPDVIGPDKQRQPQPRYFGQPADYADLYQLVRSQPGLFDQRQGIEAVLLVCQVENFKAAEVLNIISALQARQIPFGLQVVRSSYPARPLDAARIARAPAVIFASSFSGLDPANESALAQAKAKRIRLEEIDHHAARLAPLRVQGKALVLPRFDPARPQELIVHLLRPDSATSQISLKLNPVVFPAQRIGRVERFSPAQPQAVPLAMSGEQLTLELREDWVILRIELQP